MKDESKNINSKIRRLRLLIKIEAFWALISFVGFMAFTGFDLWKNINKILAIIVLTLFASGLFFGSFLIFLHNKKLIILNRKKAFSLYIDPEAAKASWIQAGVNHFNRR